MSTLYIVPTPIGNLKDITLRALEVLQSVDVILAEDTRHTAKLLSHFEISKPLTSFHQHNEHKVLNKIVEKIQSGEKMALVSDAGTPGISDPGFLLVRACVEQNIKVECLPGPTAFVPALVVSGLPADSFVFEGFLSHKKGRKTKIEQIAAEKRTTIIYESPYRLLKTLEQFLEVLGGDRKICVCRELTKIHEEVIRGTIAEVFEYYKNNIIKGEIVIVIDGNKE